MPGISKNQTQSLIQWGVEFQLKLNPQFIRVSNASKLLGKNEVLIIGIGAGGGILRKL